MEVASLTCINYGWVFISMWFPAFIKKFLFIFQKFVLARGYDCLCPLFDFLTNLFPKFHKNGLFVVLTGISFVPDKGETVKCL